MDKEDRKGKKGIEKTLKDLECTIPCLDEVMHPQQKFALMHMLREAAKEHIDILKKELKDLTKQVKKLGDTDSRKIGLGILAARKVAKMEWINGFFNLEEK